MERGSKAASHSSAAAPRAAQGITPKIDLSHISKPGDVLKAILANKQKEELEARQSHAPARPPAAAAPPAPAKTAPPASPVAAAPPPIAATTRPEPRRIVPQPRQAPSIVVPTAPPAIASRPPAGPVVAKAPAGAVAPPRPVVVVAPPPAAVVVKPPVAAPVREDAARPSESPSVVKPQAAAPAATPAATTVAAPAAPVAETVIPQPAEAPAPVAQVDVTVAPPAIEVPSATSEIQTPTAGEVAEPTGASAHRDKALPHVAPPSAVRELPARRMVMPQTGPRPVYKAPVVVPSAAPAAGTGNQAAGGIQRGRPIFDRNRPSSGPGSYPQRTTGGPAGPGQFPGGPRPKHPTRTTPGGYSGAAGPGGPGSPRRSSRLWRTSGFRSASPWRLRWSAAWPWRCTTDRRSSSPTACPIERPRRAPAVSKDQRRPDEGLRAAAAL